LWEAFSRGTALGAVAAAELAVCWVAGAEVDSGADGGLVGGAAGAVAVVAERGVLDAFHVFSAASEGGVGLADVDIAFSLGLAVSKSVAGNAIIFAASSHALCAGAGGLGGCCFSAVAELGQGAPDAGWRWGGNAFGLGGGVSGAACLGVVALGLAVSCNGTLVVGVGGGNQKDNHNDGDLHSRGKLY